MSGPNMWNKGGPPPVTGYYREPKETKGKPRKPTKPKENLVESRLSSWDSTILQAQRPGRGRIVSQGWSPLIISIHYFKKPIDQITSGTQY